MLRSLFIVLCAALWTVVLMPFACLNMLLTFSASSSIWWARKVWAPGLLWLAGARVEVQREAPARQAGPVVYVSNHQSAIDIPLLFHVLPSDVRFVAKKSLRYVPVMGWYMWLTGYVFVDRANPERAIASLRRAAERIRAGTSIIAFPEGTRSADGTVLPFKKGPFALALQARVPVVPVAIEGSGRVMPKNQWRLTPGPVRVKVGAPLDVEGYREEERERLAAAGRTAVLRLHRDIGGRGEASEGRRGDEVQP